MMILGLCILLMLPAVAHSTEGESTRVEVDELKLYDHFRALKRMQESMAAHSLEAQAQLQPSIKRAERRACEQFRRERREGVSKEEYRRQGGDEFLVFSLQLEQYCETLP
ncbi:MAG: hypothetical protein OZ918_06440 [Nitrospirales bacterium]|nr:hypothetical protein [Nitrospirales bacterium]